MIKSTQMSNSEPSEFKLPLRNVSVLNTCHYIFSSSISTWEGNWPGHTPETTRAGHKPDATRACHKPEATGADQKTRIHLTMSHTRSHKPRPLTRSHQSRPQIKCKYTKTLTRNLQTMHQIRRIQTMPHNRSYKTKWAVRGPAWETTRRVICGPAGGSAIQRRHFRHDRWGRRGGRWRNVCRTMEAKEGCQTTSTEKWSVDEEQELKELFEEDFKTLTLPSQIRIERIIKLWQQRFALPANERHNQDGT